MRNSVLDQRAYPLGVILLAGALLMATEAARSEDAQAGERLVVITTRAIRQGTVLTADMLTTKPWPEIGIPAKSFDRVDALLGQVAKVDLRTGQYLTSELVGTAKSSWLQQPIGNSRIVRISRENLLSDVPAEAADMRGEVILAVPGSPMVPAQARRILVDVEILSVDREGVTLRVQDDEVAKLALAQSVGKLLLALRYPSDNNKTSKTQARLEDIVDVLPSRSVEATDREIADRLAPRTRSRSFDNSNPSIIHDEEVARELDKLVRKLQLLPPELAKLVEDTGVADELDRLVRQRESLANRSAIQDPDKVAEEVGRLVRDLESLPPNLSSLLEEPGVAEELDRLVRRLQALPPSLAALIEEQDVADELDQLKEAIRQSLVAADQLARNRTANGETGARPASAQAPRLRLAVTTQLIPEGTILHGDMVRLVDWPAELEPLGQIETIEEVVGRRSRFTLAPHQVLRLDFLEEPLASDPSAASPEDSSNGPQSSRAAPPGLLPSSLESLLDSPIADELDALRNATQSK